MQENGRFPDPKDNVHIPTSEAASRADTVLNNEFRPATMAGTLPHQRPATTSTRPVTVGDPRRGGVCIEQSPLAKRAMRPHFPALHLRDLLEHSAPSTVAKCKPAAAVIQGEESALPSQSLQSGLEDDVGQADIAPEGPSGTATEAEGGTDANWQMAYDPVSRGLYYFHKITKETSWDRPDSYQSIAEPGLYTIQSHPSQEKSTRGQRAALGGPTATAHHQALCPRQIQRDLIQQFRHKFDGANAEAERMRSTAQEHGGLDSTEGCIKIAKPSGEVNPEQQLRRIQGGAQCEHSNESRPTKRSESGFRASREFAPDKLFEAFQSIPSGWQYGNGYQPPRPNTARIPGHVQMGVGKRPVTSGNSRPPTYSLQPQCPQDSPREALQVLDQRTQNACSSTDAPCPAMPENDINKPETSQRESAIYSHHAVSEVKSNAEGSNTEVCPGKTKNRGAKGATRGTAGSIAEKGSLAFALRGAGVTFKETDTIGDTMVKKMFSLKDFDWKRDLWKEDRARLNPEENENLRIQKAKERAEEDRYMRREKRKFVRRQYELAVQNGENPSPKDFSPLLSEESEDDTQKWTPEGGDEVARTLTPQRTITPEPDFCASHTETAVVIPKQVDYGWKIELRRKWAAKDNSKDVVTDDEVVANRFMKTVASRPRHPEAIEEERRKLAKLYFDGFGHGAFQRRRLISAGPVRYGQDNPFPAKFLGGYTSLVAEYEGLEHPDDGPMGVRLLEGGEIVKNYLQSRWDMIEKHIREVRSGLFMSPGHKEDMQQKQHRGAPHTSKPDPELADSVCAVGNTSEGANRSSSSIKPDVRLASIDGVDVEYSSVPEIQSILDKVGERVDIVIQRPCGKRATVLSVRREVLQADFGMNGEGKGHSNITLGVADDAEEEPMPTNRRGIVVSQANSVPQASKSSDFPRQESRDIVSEGDLMRQPSTESLTSFMSSCAGTSDKSLDFPSRNVSEILSFMLNHKKDANVQATALRALTNFIVPGGVDGPVGICGGQTGAGQPGCGKYGAWAEIQSIVAEAGVIEVCLEEMRIHHHCFPPNPFLASRNVRLRGIELLAALALANETNRMRIGGAGGIQAVIRAMTHNVRADFSDLRDLPLAAAGCLALRNICVNQKVNLMIFEQERGLDLLLACLKTFGESPHVQEGATGLLRSLSLGSDQARQRIQTVRIGALSTGDLLRRQAQLTEIFPVGAVVEARYAADNKWYQAEITGRKDDLYAIKWADGTWPHLRGATGHGREACQASTIFDDLDVDRNGVLSRRELHAGLIKTGFTAKRIQSTLPLLFGALDTDGDEGITKDEFVVHLHRAKDERTRIHDLVKDSADLRLLVPQKGDLEQAGNEVMDKEADGALSSLKTEESTNLTRTRGLSREARRKTAVNEVCYHHEKALYVAPRQVDEAQDMSVSPVSGRTIQDDPKRFSENGWNSLKHPIWHPRMPVKAPNGLTRRRAKERENEREVQRERWKHQRQMMALQNNQLQGRGAVKTTEVQTQSTKNQALLHMRRIETLLRTLGNQEAGPAEKPPDSPIRKLINNVFARMKKHEKHNTEYKHYHTKAL